MMRRWLPSNAEWVGDGLQCVYGCKYGWDRRVSNAWRGKIQEIIYNGTRGDLYSYFQGLESPSPTNFGKWTKGCSCTQSKVLWPLKDENNNFVQV